MKNSVRDEVFKEEYVRANDFKFTSKVAGVFDDMVNRSVPFYEEMQRMVAELASDQAQPGTQIFDLGCSTGTTLIHMDEKVAPAISFVGVDDSGPMLDKCRLKLDQLNITRTVDLVVADLNKNVAIDNASVVVLCLTLQFVRPMNRERLLKQIFDGMVAGGAVIIIEKILAEESEFNREFIKYYYDMKRRHHYSEM